MGVYRGRISRCLAPVEVTRWKTPEIGKSGSSAMRKSRRTAATALLLTLVVWSSRAPAQCDDWRAGPLIEMAGVDGNIKSVSTWDPDRSGPLAPYLIVAGTFASAG